MAHKRPREDEDSTGEDPEGSLEINTWVPLDDIYEYRRSAERGLDIRRRDTNDTLVALFKDGNAQIMLTDRGISCTTTGDTLHISNTYKNLEIDITPAAIAVQQTRSVGVYHGDNAPAEVVRVPAKRKMKLPLGVMRRAQNFTDCKDVWNGPVLTRQPGETKTQALLRAESIRQAHIANMAHLKKRVGVPYEMCACVDPVVVDPKAE